MKRIFERNKKNNNLFSYPIMLKYNRIFSNDEKKLLKNKLYKYMYVLRRRALLSILNKHFLKIYYKRLLLINELKFKYTYLNKIINILNKIYNKTIELNIIDLKYFYLNSTIYTEFVRNKILKKRRKLNRILRLSVNKVKIIKKNNVKYLSNIYKLSKYNVLQANNNLKEILKEKSNKNIYKKINKIYKKNFLNYKIKYKILNSLKNKYIRGVKLEAAGRLSLRRSASRSIYRLRYKGSLRDLVEKKNNKIIYPTKMIRNTSK